MAKRHVPRDMRAVLAEMNGSPPRSAILVGQSVLEYALEEFLRVKLRPFESEAERNKVFAFDGILGSFSNKISMAYYFKMIGPATRRELDIIRLIRNEMRAQHERGVL